MGLEQPTTRSIGNANNSKRVSNRKLLRDFIASCASTELGFLQILIFERLAGKSRGNEIVAPTAGKELFKVPRCSNSLVAAIGRGGNSCTAAVSCDCVESSPGNCAGAEELGMPISKQIISPIIVTCGGEIK